MPLYGFSLAGLKQAIAMGMLAIGIDSYINKKTWKYFIFCILAMGFHSYAIIGLIVPLFGKDVWNKRTKIFVVVFLIISLSVSQLTEIVQIITEFLGKEISEERFFVYGVNGFRLVAYSAPFILSLLASNQLKSEMDDAQLVMTKLGIMSFLFLIPATFGNPVLFGRIPSYFMIGTAICVPYLVEKGFSRKDGSVQLIKYIAILSYLFFELYSIYDQGGFQQDLFKFDFL